jgi:molybdopterin-guanine dinucleotide biosynthesis protein A
MGLASSFDPDVTRMSVASFQKITLLINAGGKSRRMGRNKALLPLPPHGIPLIEHMLVRLEPVGFGRTVIVTNDPDLPAKVQLPRSVTYVRDAYPDKGALGGIATGLRDASGWVLALACDMPLVNERVVTWLCDLAAPERGRWDVIVPLVNGHLQTLHALYHPRALPIIEAALAADHLRIADFFPAVRTLVVEEADLRKVDPALTTFISANTPEEWAEILAQLGRSN